MSSESLESESENTGPQDGLDYLDTEHIPSIFTQMGKMRKRDQFCDAKLIVGEHETCIHRAVLAAASNFFFKMFEKGVEDDKSQATFKLKDVRWEHFKYLLDFIYTGSLSVPDGQVKAVYRLSQDLRIHSATTACVQYLTSRLTPDNCLGIRKFAADDAFRDQVNKYISDNIRDVTNSKNFYGLSRISLEIVVPDEHLVNRASNEELLPLVLYWLKHKIYSNKNKVEPLTEDMIVLYLSADNMLTDCNEIEDEAVKENEVVQDYKKLTRKKQSGKVQQHSGDTGGTPNYRKFNIDRPDRPVQEPEWSIVASYKTKDRSYMVIAMLIGELVTVSLHYRPAVTYKTQVSQDLSSPVHSNSSSSENICDKRLDNLPVQGMSTNRCAFGLKALNGQLFACGGYDRGECLKSCEMYNFETNQWTPVVDMKAARSRFSIALYEGKIYACGGSSGNNNMKTVEMYDPEKNKWQVLCEAPRAKASPGIVVYKGKLFVLGGSIGQSTVSTCEVLDLETLEWKSIAPMCFQRFQIAVTVFRHKIYAIGGTNGWKCLTEVEAYDPVLNEWSLVSHLNIGRRGAGVDIYKGKIYVVGGNDGMSALNSTEIYDPETHTWSLGPTLSMHRANCGVAVLGDRLFAVGGFNGKKFLRSVEYLELGRPDYWCNNVPSEELLTHQNGDNTNNNDVIKQKENGYTDTDDITGTKTDTVISAMQNGTDGGTEGVVSFQVGGCNGDVKQDVKADGDRNS